ncbi:L,D-transpeptidase family protein [Aliarcobacter butzleri]|uniref:L,D-transpeptidase family protein n=1 Tax=Aliarcobacter butzleri TaxID=28197 RepID=UPI00263D81C3|nr:L,D-transpeptidase family protein [Aliarcobacter butzleri]MDN5061385.1 L,D-transpeptidase family protein [Aliarcobacter butzleri]
MVKLVVLVFLSLNLFAKDLVDVYRKDGIIAVEKELEKGLRDVDFWKKYLENKNTDYGFYETKEYVIVAEKENKKMTLFAKNGDDYKQISKDSMIVGEKAGDKFLEGDKKTPEGAFELVQKRTGLDQFYGPFALVTEYPNTFDKSLDKKGHGIWIHGMPFNGDREKYTQGCLALDNEKLETLAKNIDYKKTVLITSGDEFKKASKNDIALILSSIYKWKDAWKYSNIEEYLSFYSKDFKRADQSDFKKFETQKRQIFAKNETKTINLFNMDISPYPNSSNKKIYKAVMDEEYVSPSVKFVGKKELYFEIDNNKVKILSED